VPDEEDTSSFFLRDEEMSSIVTAAPRFTPRKGKADIGGRMRVAQILKSIGISSVMPERIAGATNEVWRSGDYIVRVGFVPGADRLRREAKLAQILPQQVKDAVAALPGVADARVDVVWEPPWDRDRMSDAAKLQLGLW